MIPLRSSGETMSHLKYEHYMPKIQQQVEAPEPNMAQNEAPEADVVLDREEYLEAARAFYTPNGTAQNYPDHSRHQQDENNGYSPGEDTDTSTESATQPEVEDKPSKRPEL